MYDWMITDNYNCPTNFLLYFHETINVTFFFLVDMKRGRKIEKKKTINFGYDLMNSFPTNTHINKIILLNLFAYNLIK